MGKNCGRVFLLLLGLIYFGYCYLSVSVIRFSPLLPVLQQGINVTASTTVYQTQTLGLVNCEFQIYPWNGNLPGLALDFYVYPGASSSYCSNIELPLNKSIFMICNDLNNQSPPNTPLFFTFTPVYAIRITEWRFTVYCYDDTESASFSTTEPIYLLTPNIYPTVTQLPPIAQIGQNVQIIITAENSGEGNFGEPVYCGFELTPYIQYVRGFYNCNNDGNYVQCYSNNKLAPGDTYTWTVIVNISLLTIGNIYLRIECVDSYLLVGNTTLYTISYI